MREAWEQRVRREDLRAGVLASLVVNMFGRGKNDPPLHPADFFPSLDELRPPPPTLEQEEARLDALFASVNVAHAVKERSRAEPG